MHRKSSISIREWLENSNKALLVTGIRRCGKSILLKQIMDEMKEDQGVTDDHIIYMNLEDMKYAFIKNAMDLYGYVEKLIVDEEKYYIFLDEIQMVEEFERAINSFHATKNVSIFITGSNSWLLSGELATLLSGRYVSFRVMPFRFQEMCEMLGVKKEEADEIIDVVEMAKEELTKPEPIISRLRNCITLIAPMMTIANGVPVLANNLQKLQELIIQYIK